MHDQPNPAAPAQARTHKRCPACGASKALLGTGQNAFSQAVFKKAALAAAIPSKPIDANNDGVYEWLMLDARTRLGPDGTGLASTTFHDIEGVVGTGAQTLVISPR